MTNNILGIDIAKRKFDCCFLLEDGRKISAVFSNDEVGFEQLVSQMESFNLGPFRVALGPPAATAMAWLVSFMRTGTSSAW